MRLLRKKKTSFPLPTAMIDLIIAKSVDVTLVSFQLEINVLVSL